MGKERKTNWVEMMGEAVREPAFSHSYGGEDYFLFPFRCLRLSGVEDVVNVIVSRNTMDDFDIRAGQRIALKGEVRSYNNRSGTGSKLVITVHAAQILPGQSGEDYNRVALTGNLCRKPWCIGVHRWDGKLPICCWRLTEAMQGGLLALHRVGGAGQAGCPLGGRRPGAPAGTASEPELHQGAESGGSGKGGL